MTQRANEKIPILSIMRWIVRGWSVLSIGMLLIPYVLDGLYWLQANSVRKVVGHVCFLAIHLGLIVAWFREGLGGGMTIAGFASFYATWWATGDHPRGPFLILIAAPGLLFLLVWLLSRHDWRAGAQDVRQPLQRGEP